MILLLQKPEHALWEKPSWRLPAALGGFFFLIYLLSLPHPANLWSATSAATAEGWNWRPLLVQPILNLVLLGAHLLPAAARPWAINVFNAALAGTVISLLIRAIQLWPPDRTPDLLAWQAERIGPITAARLAWFGPVMAALILGFNLNFWVQATAFTGDILDLLLLVIPLWCVVEFWHDRQIKWLWYAGSAAGAGMANSWSSLAFAPLLFFAVGSLIGWGYLIHSLAATLASFFSPDIRRPDWRPIWLLLLGVATALPWVLLLPTITWAGNSLHLSAWECLKFVLVWFHSGLFDEIAALWANSRGLALGLTSIFPLVFISLRWYNYFISHYTISSKLTDQLYWIFHLFVTIVSLWTLLGGIIGPTSLVLEQPLLLGQSFLPYYFSCALALGYCLNYLIRRLLGQSLPFEVDQWQGSLRLRRGVWLAVLLLATVADVAGVFARNFPLVRMVNHTLVADFRQHVLANLPVGPKVLVADDSRLLFLARLLLQDTPAGVDVTYWDNSAAHLADYHRSQSSTYPVPWPTRFADAPWHAHLTSDLLDQLLGSLAQQRTVIALQPIPLYSYGSFTARPRGRLFYLTPRSGPPSVEDVPPARPADTVATFEPGLLSSLTNAVNDFTFSVQELLHGSELHRLIALPPGRDVTAVFFAGADATTVNDLGVRAQREGRWDEARHDFELALRLNHFNLSARANLDYNRHHQAERPDVDRTLNNPDPDLAAYHDIIHATSDCGQIDSPPYLMLLGDELASADQELPAMDAFCRVLQLEPANYGARMWLASLNLEIGRPQMTLDLLQQIRPALAARGWLDRFALNLDVLEAEAQFNLHHKELAYACMDRVISSAGDNPDVMIRVVENLWRNGFRPEVIDLLGELVDRHPDRPAIYVLRALIFQNLGETELADQDYTRALALNPANDAVRFRHACLLIKLGRLDDATTALQLILKHHPEAFPAHFALAQVALIRPDKSLALVELKNYLRLAATNSPDYATALRQLKSLQ